MSAGETEPNGRFDRPGDGDTASAPETRRRRLKRFVIQVDSKPSLLTAAGALRRRLPGDDRFGDALSTAGSHPAEVMARGVSALQPGRKSVAQELGLAGLQVWQSLSEATGRGRGDRPLAILFTDLVGFSAWALRAGDAATLELLRAVGTALEDAVTSHDGRIVKRLGDGVMATFLAARPAVDAALDAQAAIAEIELDGHTPQMRAGVHWGSPRKLGGDYLGVDVNVAARVAAAAKADQVLISGTVVAQIGAHGLQIGRAKRLRARGAPRDLQVSAVARS